MGVIIWRFGSVGKNRQIKHISALAHASVVNLVLFALTCNWKPHIGYCQAIDNVVCYVNSSIVNLLLRISLPFERCVKIELREHVQCSGVAARSEQPPFRSSFL